MLRRSSELWLEMGEGYMIEWGYGTVFLFSNHSCGNVDGGCRDRGSGCDDGDQIR